MMAPIGQPGFRALPEQANPMAPARAFGLRGQEMGGGFAGGVTQGDMELARQLLGYGAGRPAQRTPRPRAVLPAQANAMAQQRAFGQQGIASRAPQATNTGLDQARSVAPPQALDRALVFGGGTRPASTGIDLARTFVPQQALDRSGAFGGTPPRRPAI